MIKRMTTVLLLMTVYMAGIEMVSVGDQQLLRSDGTTFSAEKTAGADTLWTLVYGFYNTQFNGYFSIYFEVDTMSGDSSKTELILEQGNSPTNLNYVTSIATVDSAADWDTTLDITTYVQPMSYFRVGLFHANSDNDTCYYDNLILFAQ